MKLIERALVVAVSVAGLEFPSARPPKLAQIEVRHYDGRGEVVLA